MSQIGNLALDAEALYQELVRGVRQLIAQSGVAYHLVGVTSGGAWLARLELSIALEEILARTSHFSVDGPVETTLCPEIGAMSVPLRWTAA